MAGAPGAALLSTPVYLGDRVRSAVGVDPAKFTALSSRLQVITGDLGDLDDESMVATAGAALEHGWRYKVLRSRMTMADGEAVTLRLAAILV